MPARYYIGTNPDEAIGGVPLRDLDQDEYDALPAWLQASVDASHLYRKSRPRVEPADAPKQETPKDDTKKEP